MENLRGGSSPLDIFLEESDNIFRMICLPNFVGFEFEDPLTTKPVFVFKKSVETVKVDCDSSGDSSGDHTNTITLRTNSGQVFVLQKRIRLHFRPLKTSLPFQ